MANVVPTPTWVTREVAQGYLNAITFVANINREYSDQYVQSGAKVGDLIKVRLPQRFNTTSGQAFQAQALYEPVVNIPLTEQKNVGFGWSSAEGTTDIQDVRDRYVTPAADALANAHDVFAYEQVYRDIWNSVGTPGTGTTTNSSYLDAKVAIINGAGGNTKQFVAVLSPEAMADIVGANLTLFNPSATISEQYTNGMFGRKALGINDWYQDANAPVFETGAVGASTPLVDGASQTGDTLLTNGWASGDADLKKGDIITVAGVNSVNLLSYADTGSLQQFVVTADISDTAGAIDIPISPSIITSGQLRTVTASPANDAVVTYWAMSAGGSQAATSSRQSLVFQKNFAATVMADLIRPAGDVEVGVVRSKQWNVAIRMVEQYQFMTDQNPSRLDILIGAATLQARLATRVQGV